MSERLKKLSKNYMEFLYYWIDEEITFKNIGFHFSNRFFFRSVLNEKEKTFELSVKLNENYIPNFYGSHILSLSAIVGKNGTGKTNLFFSIISKLTEYNNVYGYKYILAYYDSDKKKIRLYHSFFHEDAEYRINLQGDAKSLIEVIEIPVSTNYWQEPTNWIHKPNNTGIIYCNPIYDFRDYPFSNEYRPFADVSSTFLLANDRGHRSLDHFNMVAYHKFQEIERQYTLIKTDLLKTTSILNEINIPSEIIIEFLKINHVEKKDLGFKASRSYDWLRNYASLVFQVHNSEKDKYHDDDVKRSKALIEKAKTWFLANLIDNFFESVAREKDLDDEKYNLNVSEFKKFKENEELFNRSGYNHSDWPRMEIDEYRDYVIRFFQEQNFLKEDVFNIPGFIKNVFELIDEYAISNDYLDDNTASFYLPIDNGIEIIKLHEAYSYALNDEYNQGFFRMTWRNLSSGESAFLSLLSRIYYGIQQFVSEKIKINGDLEFIYLMIDEGEHSFHPEWQKKYIKVLIDFLKQFKKYKFQLFFASHSPILLSDVLKENVIFIKKEKPGISEISENESHQETFASNIHSLFKDSFFISDGLIGDFSKETIQKIRKELNEDIDVEKYSEIEKKINLIGEPILKNKLKEILVGKMPDQLRREYLINELRKLDKKESSE